MKAGIAIVGLIVIVVVGVIAFQAVGSDSTQSPQNITGNSQNNKQNITQDTYEDGTYQAVGSYITPGGAQEVGVTVTLANGVIEDVEVDMLGTLEISKEKQADFAAHYKPMVVGKNIDEVELGKVSGSSLTPIGFNNALDEIKETARS